MSEKEATLGPCDACQPSAKDADALRRHVGPGVLLEMVCARCNGTGKERIVQIQVAETSMFALTSNGRVFQHKDAYTRRKWIEVMLPFTEAP
jgi:hypothetical protein